MLYFFAGANHDADLRYILKSGAKNCLQTFFYVDEHKKMFHVEQFKRYWFDSGGYTGILYNQNIDIVKYSEFLKEEKISHAFELDTNDFNVTNANRTYLLHNNPETKIIPIFHLSDFIDTKKRFLLDSFIDENYDLIGLGGLANLVTPDDLRDVFFKYVFTRTKDKIKVHGLGFSRKKFLMKYPFYSIDSTSWLRTRKYKVTYKKGSMAEARHALYTAHDWLETDIAESVLALEKNITDLWITRGVEWKD